MQTPTVVADQATFKDTRALTTWANSEGEEIAVRWSKRVKDGWVVHYASKQRDCAPTTRIAFVRDGDVRYSWSMICD